MLPGKMKNIYIVRHGQNEDNAEGILNGHRDRPLTNIGEEQASQLAQSLKSANIHIDKIYSSPLQRAYHTGEIIADFLHINKPEKMDLLIERDFGIMTGKPIVDIERLCAPNIIKSGTITYFIDPEGAETFPQLLERAKKALTVIQNKQQDKDILITTHGDFGKMLYAAYYGLDREDVLITFHFGNSEVLLLAPNTRPEDAHLFQTQQYNH